MIGNIEDAELIGEWGDYSSLPDGWFCVGEGSARVAFISPDGIVYKVEKELGCNSDEYTNIERLSKMHPLKGWRIPQATLYELPSGCVMAMEYIAGVNDTECQSRIGLKCSCEQKPCIDYLWDVAREYWGVIDFSSFNVLVEPDGTRVLVDIEA